MEKKGSEKMNSTMEKKRSEKMREIREAAVAYFKNMPADDNDNARSFFNSMDTNDDQKIIYAEFSKRLKELDVSGDQDLDNKLFEELDENGDGYLNFNEFLTFVYIHDNGRLMYCDGCQHFLTGLYFSCAPCFDLGQPMDKYCTACYHDGRHSKHQHSCDETARFVDNYALLLKKAGSTDGAAQATQPGFFEVSGQLGNRQRLKKGAGYLLGKISNLFGGKAIDELSSIM